LDHDAPDQLAAVLRQDGHSVLLLRDVLPIESSDSQILGYALESQAIVITCNRQDFLQLCATRKHHGVIILVRRKTRVAEYSAVLRLVRRAGESGLKGNINFA
jgi:predicted nuclease of predicted toxin-antitoxin system